MAEAKCPASGGELIQGWIAGGEKLVSCPIDWFSTVEVCEGRRPGYERPLMRRMLEKVVASLGYSQEVADALRIDLQSTIPVGKGLASSTADIAATAVATARHLGGSLTESVLASLCVQLEPSDSTLFRSPTLFDHHRASVQIACRPLPPVSLLLLEGRDTVLTADYHRINRQQTLRDHSQVLDSAWQLLQTGCEMQEARRVGEAATLSAVASQQILAKPLFAQLLKLVEKQDLYGLNVAHSGSVVGLLFEPHRHDAEAIAHSLVRLGVKRYYPRQHSVRIVAGGVR